MRYSISQLIKGGEKWDTDPTLGMIVDNRSFTASQKLPYTFFFEGLVRQCLLNYLKGNSMGQNLFAYGSNMSSGRFRAYRVRPEGAGRGALLSGYRLLFNKESTDGSGKANVEAHEGSETWGVLYVISNADLRTLDDGEVGYRGLELTVRSAEHVDLRPGWT